MHRKAFDIGLIALLTLLLTACNRAQAPTATAIPATPTTAAIAPTPTPPPTPTPQPAAALPPPAETDQAWWRDAIFYEVFVRSFYDSDGDGIGDFRGLTAKLDYLNDGDPATTTDLGITGLWLMPIHPSPSYHGYDITDYYGINPQYGTMDDFRQFVAAAHERGIRVIIDLVINHSSTQHPWFQKSVAGDPAYADWYVWSDDNPGFRGPWGQPVWHKASNGRFYYGIFWDQMPDLNLSNPVVRDEIYNVLRFWLAEVGVDGFRLDAVRHYVEMGAVQENSPQTHTWLKDFGAFYRSVKPDAFTVGEAWTDTANVIPYLEDELDSAFEFDLAAKFITASHGPIANSTLQHLQFVMDSYPEGRYATFLANHDQDRVNSQLRDDERAKLAATMLLTSPGIPFLYYGEEIGMTGVKPDEDIRRPMQWDSDTVKVGFSDIFPWRAPASDWEERSVALQQNDPASLLSHYRTLLQLRAGHAALRTGATAIVDPGTPRLFSLLRYDEDEAFLVLVNVHPRPLTVELYKLNLAAGPFRGPVNVEVILGPANPATFTATPAGGFADYLPYAEIPAASSVILRLTQP